MSRLVKKRNAKLKSRSRVRPFVLASVAVSALLAGLGIAQQDRANYGLPIEEISTGLIWVEGQDIPINRNQGDGIARTNAGGGARATSEAVETPTQPQLPISFYETLGNGLDPVKMDPATVARGRRDLPIPPPMQAVVMPTVAQAPDAGAKSTARERTPDRAQTASSRQVEPPVQVAAISSAGVTKATTRPSKSAPADRPPAPDADDIASIKAESAAIVRSLQTSPEDVSDTSSVALPYTLQVASFSTRDRADELLERLKSKDQAAYLVDVTIPDKGTWWRVRVGRYATYSAAKWARLDLIRLGVDPLVIRDTTQPAS